MEKVITTMLRAPLTKDNGMKISKKEGGEKPGQMAPSSTEII